MKDTKKDEAVKPEVDETEDTGTDAAESDDETGEDGEMLDIKSAKDKIHKTNREAANLRIRLKELEEKAAKYDEIEDSKKSDLERESEARSTAEKRVAELESQLLRSEVASSKGLSPSQAKFLTGSTQAEMEASADELQTAFASSSSTDKPARPDVNDLRGGADPTEDLETDPHKLREMIKGSRR